MVRKASSRNPSTFDRVAVACFLGLFFTALFVVVYDSLVTTVSNTVYWFGLLTTMTSGLIGYLFGANRRIQIS